MRRIFISGNDTGVGKTWVMRSLARHLASKGAKVQVFKPVQTGVEANQPDDIETVVSGYETTIQGQVGASFPLPLAPLTAAAQAGKRLSLESLCALEQALPTSPWRLIEGAGGLAVPIDPRGYDWADFTRAIRGDLTLLVVEDRLGAINQARLLGAYARSKGLQSGFWLNEVTKQTAAVRQSNREAIEALKNPPLWAMQSFENEQPEFLRLPLF